MALSVRNALIESGMDRSRPTSIGSLVLAVDDEPDGRDLVTALLSQVGYDVVTAASGEEALETAVRRPPDLVVLDVVLPGIDGFETCRRLKRQLGDSLPVLMLSGRGRSAVIQGLGAGADDYLPKPFDVEEFWARVEALLRIRSAEASARRRAERLLSLARLSTAVTGRLDEVEVMRLVLGEALRLLDAQGAAFYGWDDAAQVLRRQQAVGLTEPNAFGVRRPGEGVTGQAFERRQPIWVNDYGDWPAGRPDARVAGTRAAVAAPLLFGDAALGVLVAWQTRPSPRFEGEDAQLLGLLAGQAAASLNAARMYAAERTAATRAAERAAQLEAIGESLADGILIVDGAGTITSANRAAVDLLGRSRGTLVGMPAARALPEMRWPDGKPIAAEGLPLMVVLRRGRPSVDRELVVDVGGRERILIDTTVPLRGPDGQLAGAVSVFRDVTDRRRADERQVEAEKLRALGQMASGVAHDVNNLLAGVLGRAELARLEIERGRLDPQRVAESLRLIEQAAEDGAHTVRRIQEFARVRRDSNVMVVDLAQIVMDTIKLTRPQWRNAAQAVGRTIEVHPELEPGLLVAGEPAELREVFINLMLNAVDAMPRGGRITITGRSGGQIVRVEVADSGVGMTPEVRRRVFEPFFTTKAEAGMGLGLAVSYGIVQRRGGSFDLESAPGRGSRFILQFPLAEAQPAATSELRVLPTARRRILVVDDEPALASVLRSLLESDGHEVTPCTGGYEALRAFEPDRHDLVMTDLGMADLNGLELAAAIHGRSPRTPIVLVTGWGNELDPDDPPRGIARVLPKPYRLATVLEAVNGALGWTPGSADERSDSPDRAR